MVRVRGSSFLAAAIVALAALPSTAFAAPEFEAGEDPATVSGEQVEGGHVLTLKSGEAECGGTTLTGELDQPSAALTVAPAYSGCTLFGLAATVKTEGCLYEFHAGEETKENEFKGTMDIECPKEHAIVITAASEMCKIKIGSQSGLSGVVYKSHLAAEPADLTIVESIGGISYTGSGALCSSESGSGATLEGNVLAGASSKAEAVGFAVVELPNTKLCQKAPMDVCPPNEEYGASSIQGVAITPAQDMAVIRIYNNANEEKNALGCQESEINGNTKAKAEDPLVVEKISATFKKDCTTFAGTSCGKVEMENAPATGSLVASRIDPGVGRMYVPVTLRIECKGELECKYAKTDYLFWFNGGTVASIKPSRAKPGRLANVGVAKEEGCLDHAEWVAAYAVAKPAPVWVSN
jgi:hypothetical protein